MEMNPELTNRPTLPAGVSVVVPVYNSANMLADLVARLQPVLIATGRSFELVLVNDCSPDASWGVIQRLASEHEWVRGLRMMRNYGQHNALLAGIRAARFATLVTMDDDLQHPPEELPRLLAAFAGDVDVLYGTPQQLRHGLLRDLSSAVTKMVLKGAMGADTARLVSAWRVFRTELREGFSTYDSPFVNIDVLLTWSANRFRAVPVRHESRASGSSNYTVAKLIRHTLNMMTGFSVLPLQIASIVGFAFTLFGMAVLAYVVGRYLMFGSTVAGFPFLASIIAIFSGAQLFALGIMGEYLARIHFRTMNRPAYTVAESTLRPVDEQR
ncbi:glycosyltransferase family 2 protein [Oleiharenicola sp. Vm1]|uniref:glycosyltransferase family 2 protein n=1 Tax=Oleiharenicola sp. Vm1 TaxID=3398393 RepID=UPI0039F5411C